MNKKTAFVSLALLALGLSACGGGPAPEASSIPSSEESSSSSSKPFNPVQPDYTPVHPTEWGLSLKQPTNALPKDFAFGVDCSSVLEVEQGGGKYYVQENGQWKEKELFRAMADGGATHARIRLWHNPYDLNGGRYGGGTNDLQNDITIATRAQKAGLKILLDFHYSDSWVDPGKYYAPKAWAEMDPDTLIATVYDYTREVMDAFYDAGIEIHSVQLGNEINPGIAGLSSGNYGRLSKLIANGMKAVKEVYPEAKTIVHYTDITSSSILFTRIGYLKKYKALPDIVGLSYYPYWHGTLDNLQYVMDTIANDYGTEVQVVETSWGYTDDWHDYCHNQYSSATSGEAGGYVTSPQGQASVLANIVDCLSKVPNGKGTGIYYWEPAWLPNQYSGWITEAGYYYNDTGRDWTTKLTPAELAAKYPEGSCYSSWANQALFDYDGHALDSLYTYYHLAKGDHFVEETVTELTKTEFSQTVNLADDWKAALPTTVRAYTNLGSSVDVPVAWNQEEIDAIVSAGYYVIHGEALDTAVTLNIKAIANFVRDPGFEQQYATAGHEAKFVNDVWTLVTTNGYKADQGDAWIEAKNELGGTGNQYLHWYTASTPLEFTLAQDLGTVVPGTYEFGFSTRSSWYLGGDNKAPYDDFKLVLKVDGTDMEFDCRELCTEDSVLDAKVGEIEIEANTSVIMIFVCKTSSGGAWGNLDDFYFSAKID